MLCVLGARQKLPLQELWRWRGRRWLLRNRRAGSDVLERVLGQTFVTACVLSVLSLAVDAYLSVTELPQVLVGKVLIAVGFGGSALLTRVGWRRSALLLSLVATVGSLASSAAAFGPSTHGYLQLSSLWLLPFLGVVATLGDLRAALISGTTVALASLAVTRSWGVTPEDQLLSLFVSLMAGGVAVAMAMVIAGSKRQTQHDQRVSRRMSRRVFLAQQARASSERLAAVGQLASTMAHEINNPLSYTMANLRFVNGVLGEHPEAKSFEEARLALEQSGEGLQRIQEIVERMSAFREPAQAGASTADLKRALELSLAGLSLPAAARSRVHLDCSEALPPVGLDERQLGRVVRAVVSNALEAVRPKEGQVHVAAARAKNRVEVTIEDDGPGFEAATLRRLFEPFVTARDPSRLGLSLALSRELLRSIGGELDAGNRPEGGARVVLKLPLSS